MRKFLLIILAVLSPLPLFAQTFSRTLSLGMFGEDVKVLQMILNKDSRTAVSVSGLGSLGNETEYFGEKTKDAVIRFQNIYKDEILVPLGVRYATGIVGEKTQKKLLEVNNSSQQDISNINVNQTIDSVMPRDSITNNFLSSLYSPQLKLFSIYPLTARPGQKITIQGQGFSKDNNTVHFGQDISVENIPSLNGLEITVTVPEKLPEGSYNVWISYGKKSSFNVQYGNFFSVSNNPTPPPTITSPKDDVIIDAQFSGVVLLPVAGLISGETKILTSIGEVRGAVNGDNKIIFNLKDGLEWGNFLNSLARVGRLPIYVYVANQTGFSSPAIIWIRHKI